MSCKTCLAEKADDAYVNCEDCREEAATARRNRYAIQQYKINPVFEPREEKVDGMTKKERVANAREHFRAAMTSCAERSMFSSEYESTETYCGLCDKPTLERNLYKCLCKACRRLVRYNYKLAETT